ncbi:MAG: alanyl-tRNA editing protein [Lachnospiraceae bacterium]|nr:alanyl-tRNA editing protein [Lachnospiraceae bacterium]
MLDSSSVKTGKIYYEDAYRVSFSAKAIHIEGRDAVLDKTAFFPEEGGQSPDRGFLGGIRVLDVKIRDGFIHHILEKEPDFAEGEYAEGRIDWRHRFSNMQQHSGEHLFSGIICKRFGYDNVGFHLSEKEVSVDFNGTLGEDELLKAEALANEAITANVPSEIIFLEGQEADQLEYRSKLSLKGSVRIVRFGDYDACACCAPHVRRTGEIGLLKVLSAVSWKGGTRVFILCGRRAMEYFDQDHEILTRTAKYLTTSREEVYNSVLRARKERDNLKEALRKRTLELMFLKAEAVPEGSGNVILFESGLEGDSMRELTNALLLRRRGFCGVFSGNDAEGYNFVIGARNEDARKAAGVLKERLNARGGGKPEMVQGSVRASQKEIENIFKLCLQK